MQHLPFDNPDHSDKGEIDFSNLIYAFWQGKWLIILTTVVTIFVGGYYAFVVVTPAYLSSSVVILEPKKDKIVTFQSISDGFTGGTPQVNSEVEILRARSLMGDVVEHLRLYNDPEFNRSLTPPTAKVVLKSQIKRKLGWSAPPEKLSPDNFDQRTRDPVISSLLQKVRIENLPKSTVFRISVQTKRAAKSALIADTISEIYIQNQVSLKISTAAKATVWLENRVAELQVKLEQAETKASDFSASTALVSSESLQVLKRQIKSIRERIISAEQAKVFTALNSKSLESASNAETKIAIANDEQLTRFAKDKALKVAFDNRFEAIKVRATSDHIWAHQQLQALKASEAELGLQIAKQSKDLISLQQLTREAHATRVLYEHFLSILRVLDHPTFGLTG
jgi:succinoglycan biosynthesis transport protein ExoP